MRVRLRLSRGRLPRAASARRVSHRGATGADAPRGEGESSINAIGAVYYMLKVTIALLIGRVDRAPREQGAQSDET